MADQQKLNQQLGQAAYWGNIARVKAALKAGADVHAGNDYALRRASENGHAGTVRILLDVGADVHAWNGEALRLASRNGHTVTVKVLEAASRAFILND
jgi:hypothetical protein